MLLTSSKYILSVDGEHVDGPEMTCSPNFSFEPKCEQSSGTTSAFNELLIGGLKSAAWLN